MSVVTRRELTNRWNPFKKLEEMEKGLSSIFGHHLPKSEKTKPKSTEVNIS
jgi:hypothetical protein